MGRGISMNAALDKIMEARKYDGVVVKGQKAPQPSGNLTTAEHDKARAGLFPALVGSGK